MKGDHGTMRPRLEKARYGIEIAKTGWFATQVEVLSIVKVGAIEITQSVAKRCGFCRSSEAVRTPYCGATGARAIDRRKAHGGCCSDRQQHRLLTPSRG